MKKKIYFTLVAVLSLAVSMATFPLIGLLDVMWMWGYLPVFVFLIIMGFMWIED